MNATVDDIEFEVGSENEHVENIFHQNVGNTLSKHWVLIDNQSTLDQFVNAEYLTGIHTVLTPIIVYCNAGSTSTTRRVCSGTFQFGSTWTVLQMSFPLKPSQIITW